MIVLVSPSTYHNAYAPSVTGATSDPGLAPGDA